MKPICDICKYKDDDEALYGKMYTKFGLNIHYYCLLSSPIPQNGLDTSGIMGFLKNDITESIKKCGNNLCHFCKRLGAAVKCNDKGCKKMWHYGCGRNANCITQFLGEFKSFCSSHVPDSNVIKHDTPRFCIVCYTLIAEYHPATSIFSSCCAEAYKHDPQLTIEELDQRGFTCFRCVQKYAFNAGYDAMCINCPMGAMTKEEWQNHMRLKGIFIPYQMAVWEDDEYFRSQIKRKCGNSNCTKRTRDVWTCYVCGCFPLHLSCANVKTHEEYYCPKCINESFIERIPKPATSYDST